MYNISVASNVTLCKTQDSTNLFAFEYIFLIPHSVSFELLLPCLVFLIEKNV